MIAAGSCTDRTIDVIQHDYYLNGTQIIAETWTQSGIEYLMYYLYNENGAPIGLHYRTSNYASSAFEYYYFEKNLQGDIIGIYNADGKKICTYTYDAWGNFNYSLASGNTALETRIVFRLNPFRYRGYYYDVETGYYYLQSRYYNPEWGRFLNADSYASTGTGLLGYNMFAYCNNNPVMFTDPAGDFPFLIIGVIAAVIVGSSLAACQTPPREETYHFESYDNYEDAYRAGMRNTFEAASKVDFEYEYGCIIVQYPNDENFYLSNIVTNRKLQMVELPFPQNATPIADIHSHPWHKSEPFTSDGRHSHDQFIVDIDRCGYLLKGGRRIDQWEEIEWDGEN